MEKAKEDLEKTRNEITNIDKLRSDLKRLQINQSQLINDFDRTASYIDDKNIENSNKIISKFENIEKNWNKDFLRLETNLKSKFENNQPPFKLYSYIACLPVLCLNSPCSTATCKNFPTAT